VCKEVRLAAVENHYFAVNQYPDVDMLLAFQPIVVVPGAVPYYRYTDPHIYIHYQIINKWPKYPYETSSGWLNDPLFPTYYSAESRSPHWMEAMAPPYVRLVQITIEVSEMTLQ